MAEYYEERWWAQRRKDCPEHEIPKRFSKYVRPNEEFVELLKGCALNGAGRKIDWDSFEVVTAQLEDIIDQGYHIRREITSNDVESLVRDIHAGKNGIGLSWSYDKGHAEDINLNFRYSVEFFARVLSADSIDFEDTYCHDQFDAGCGHRDFEIVMREGHDVLLEKIVVSDKVTNKKWTVRMGIDVKISRER